MVKAAIHRFAIGGTGDLAVAFGGFDHQIVAARGFRRYAQRIQRRQHDICGNGFIVLRFAGHKGKAGIAQIVEYRAAAAAATGQAHVIFFHTSGVALFPRVLRAANDHRIGIAPQKQHPLSRGHLAKNRLLNRQIEPGVVRVGEQQAQRGHGDFLILIHLYLHPAPAYWR